MATSAATCKWKYSWTALPGGLVGKETNQKFQIGFGGEPKWHIRGGHMTAGHIPTCAREINFPKLPHGSIVLVRCIPIYEHDGSSKPPWELNWCGTRDSLIIYTIIKSQFFYILKTICIYIWKTLLSNKVTIQKNCVCVYIWLFDSYVIQTCYDIFLIEILGCCRLCQILSIHALCQMGI